MGRAAADGDEGEERPGSRWWRRPASAAWSPLMDFLTRSPPRQISALPLMTSKHHHCWDHRDLPQICLFDDDSSSELRCCEELQRLHFAGREEPGGCRGLADAEPWRMWGPRGCGGLAAHQDVSSYQLPPTCRWRDLLRFLACFYLGCFSHAGRITAHMLRNSPNPPINHQPLLLGSARLNRSHTHVAP